MRGGARPCGGAGRGGAVGLRSSGERGRGAAARAAPVPAGLPGGGRRGLLDFQPKLGPRECSQVVAAAATAAAVAAAVAASPGPPLVAALAAGGLVRELSMERLHAERYVSPAELALPGSGFGAFGGLQRLHYRVQRAGSVGPGEAAWACHFFHGFGASLFSWLNVLQLVAEGCRGVCSAHDAPGFGLTERPVALESFSPAASARAGVAVLEAAVAEEIEAGGEKRQPPPRRALVAHSLGALSAMVSATSQPLGHFDAIVLVAPAVFAPRPFPDLGLDLWKHLPRQLVYFSRAALRTLAAAVFVAVKAVVLCPPVKLVLLVSLRKLVRTRGFWAVALRACYHDSRRVTQKVVDGYRAAKETTGWDVGLLKFSLAMFKSTLCGPTPSETFQGLVRLTEAQSLPVLILHGARDRIVPPENSTRLAEAIPGCTLSVWPDTGHLPHEEYPEKFAAEVSQFLCRVQP